jgi:hypothetical protein
MVRLYSRLLQLFNILYFSKNGFYIFLTISQGEGTKKNPCNPSTIPLSPKEEKYTSPFNYMFSIHIVLIEAKYGRGLGVWVYIFV